MSNSEFSYEKKTRQNVYTNTPCLEFSLGVDDAEHVRCCCWRISTKVSSLPETSCVSAERWRVSMENPNMFGLGPIWK